MCSFTVSVFDVCLQDDSNPSIVMMFNSSTGEYRFCCGGAVFVGVGKVTIHGNVYILQHTSPGDRRVVGRVDSSLNIGNATLQVPAGTTICTITDRDTTDNTCSCM
jgi:hypothetical protein